MIFQHLFQYIVHHNLTILILAQQPFEKIIFINLPQHLTCESFCLPLFNLSSLNLVAISLEMVNPPYQL